MILYLSKAQCSISNVFTDGFPFCTFVAVAERKTNLFDLLLC